MLGQEFLRLLGDSKLHEVRCLARRENPVARLEGLELAYGDARDVRSMAHALRGMDAFVHIAGIEYAPWILKACARAGVGRLVVISSTSVYSRFEFRSAPKRRMEELVRRSGLEWTVIRPSMIYGSELDKNVSKLLRFLDRWPVFPMFGSGKNLWQPVYHEDLARGVYAALENEKAVGQSYDLPGARALTYEALVQAAAKALDRKARIVKIPAEPVARVLEVAEKARAPLPIKAEQVLRLSEDKAYPYEKANEELGYAPRAFEEGVALEVRRLREAGLIGCR